MVVGTWLSLQQGVTPTPGFLGIATIVALYQDSKLRKSTKQAVAPSVSPTT
jgi:hypothetical protein